MPGRSHRIFARVREIPLFDPEQKPNLTRDDALAELRRRGATRAVAAFSGGNDEGGVDGIELFDEEGRSLGTITEHWQAVGEPDLTKEQLAEDRLARALAEPVRLEYGDFDGDIYARGEVVWNVADGRVVMRGGRDAWETFEREVGDA